MRQRDIDVAQQQWLVDQCFGRVLHVGCGPKPICPGPGCRATEVINIDPNPTRAEWRDADIDVHDLDQYYDEGSFDSVVSSHVLPSLKRLPVAVYQMARVLRPGGIMSHIIPDWSVAPQRKSTKHVWQFQHQGWYSPDEFMGWFSHLFRPAYPGLLEVIELEHFPDFRWSFKFRARKRA